MRERFVGGEFIVDWQVSEETRVPVAWVAVRMQGRKAGLHRVRPAGRDGLMLSCGAISFPVGTQLEIEEFQHLVPHAGHPLRVVSNAQRERCLAW